MTGSPMLVGMDGRKEELVRFGLDCWSRAKGLWPKIHVAPARFARHLVAALGNETDTPRKLDAFHGEDLFLACACDAGDRGALQQLETVLLPQVGRALRRIAPAAAAQSELLQELRQRLLLPGPSGATRLLAYSGRGKLLHWLKASALRAALNLRPAERPEEISDDEAVLNHAGVEGDPELEYVKRRHRPQF